MTTIHHDQLPQPIYPTPAAVVTPSAASVPTSTPSPTPRPVTQRPLVKIAAAAVGVLAIAGGIKMLTDDDKKSTPRQTPGPAIETVATDDAAAQQVVNTLGIDIQSDEVNCLSTELAAQPIVDGPDFAAAVLGCVRVETLAEGAAANAAAYGIDERCAEDAILSASGSTLSEYLALIYEGDFQAAGAIEVDLFGFC